VVMALLMAGCTTWQIAPAEALQRLTAAYDHPTFDPSAAAWEELVTHTAYAKGEIGFLEIMALNETENALEQVNACLDALTAAIEEAGGELIYVYDVLSEGTGDLFELDGELYRGGVAYSVRFPSRAALVETMLSQPVIEVRQPISAQTAGSTPRGR
jgi:hypothetical protein